MEARNRTLTDWFPRIRTGQVLLPRFQRHEAWTHREVASLLESVLRGLPTGAALTLDIGDVPPFHARPIVGAPEPTERVSEHLLDGQQRLTALWRALHDDYDDRTYLIGLEHDEDDNDQVVVRGEPRYSKKGVRYPLWVDEPKDCWTRGWIPIRLCSPDADRAETKQWASAATDEFDATLNLIETVNNYSSIIGSFNIPFLGLPVGTSRDTALDVFIKMNTSSVKLSSFDIVVAQYEAATGRSLHDQLSDMTAAVPRVSEYRDAENLLLDVASLREDRAPSQSSYRRLDLELLADDFDDISEGVKFAIDTLENEAIFDSDRLPTVAVLPILGALHHHVPKFGDERGNALALIRSYLWRAFTTSRYESSAGTRALQDLRGLVAALNGQANNAPIFDEDEFRLPGVGELTRTRWPKSREILARAVLCATLRRGAIDLADGARAAPSNMKTREYHHLFPDAYLEKNTDLGRGQIYTGLNCSLITWATNRRIGAKPPLVYLQERVDQANLGEGEIRKRLESHLIPWDEFASPGPDVAASYAAFLEARAELVSAYLYELCHGREPNG